MNDKFYLTLTQSQRAAAHKCTPLEREFVCKWVSMGCDPSRSVEAMIAAYGDAMPDVKTATLKKRVDRMLEKESVNNFIDALRVHSIHNAIMDKEEAQLLLSFKARSNIDDVLEWDEYIAGYNDDQEPIYQTAWRIKNIRDMPAHVKASIKSVSIDSAGRPKIELYDSSAAKRLLADIKGWKAPTQTKTEHSGPDGSPLGFDPSALDEKTIKKMLEASTKKILEAL